MQIFTNTVEPGFKTKIGHGIFFSLIQVSLKSRVPLELNKIEQFEMRSNDCRYSIVRNCQQTFKITMENMNIITHDLILMGYQGQSLESWTTIAAVT